VIVRVPLEDEEQAAFVQWLRLKGYPHFRVPSETYTKSWRQKAKNKALGVVRGVPDLFIVTTNGLMAIEMKRVKGSVTSAEQKQWIEILCDAGVPAFVAKGAEQAIRITEQQGSSPRRAEKVEI
jgi:hypothetical protein